ncbi:hypothetical protein [Candidatus Rhodoblastus alkanivorans]|uniref:hypothetical protein n=1 Tax=Candidatus Rhodoblastus alkanivorans TaxID=2954117 RepID=UPI003CC87032
MGLGFQPGEHIVRCGLNFRAEAGGRELFRDARRRDGSIDFVQSFLGRDGFRLTLAQAGEGGFGLRKGRLLRPGGIDTAAADQLALFRFILEPLRALIPETAEEERQYWAQSLFSAVHGVVALGLERKFVAVPPERLDEQIERFVHAICAGIEAAGPH